MEEHTMATLETYQARADSDIALSLAGTTSPFTIEVRFLGGLTQPQMDAFKGAADRWSRMIVGDLPGVLVDGEVIDDVLILAQGAEIDGPGRILGQAGPTHVRPATAGDAAFIPAKGRMTFDTADLEQMEQEGTLNDVITHEMGHVIGSGTIWDDKGFLKGRGTENPTFEGPSAMEEYGKLRGDGTGPPTPVPVENEGGPGTRDSHWRESVFRSELLTGRIGEAGNPISHMSVGSLQDLGYVVDMNAAEPYELPNLLSLAEEGLLVSHEAPIDVGIMLPNIPEVLPEDSLQ
jgi:Leishmanolysin